MCCSFRCSLPSDIACSVSTVFVSMGTILRTWPSWAVISPRRSSSTIPRRRLAISWTTASPLRAGSWTGVTRSSSNSCPSWRKPSGRYVHRNEELMPRCQTPSNPHWVDIELAQSVGSMSVRGSLLSGLRPVQIGQHLWNEICGDHKNSGVPDGGVFLDNVVREWYQGNSDEFSYKLLLFTIFAIWMSLHFTNDQSILVQVMAWCCQATSHYLSQCWPRSLSPYGVTRPERVKVPGTQLLNEKPIWTSSLCFFSEWRCTAYDPGALPPTRVIAARLKATNISKSAH